MKMISKFGIEMRKFRATTGESLRSMSEKLNISATFLSAMEVGRKSIPMEYAKKIKEVYNLSEVEYAALHDSIIETNQRVDIEIAKMNEAQKEVSMVFARKIENADPELLEKLRKALEDDKN
jgi:predicted transcriptional regulator